jgi:transposase
MSWRSCADRLSAWTGEAPRTDESADEQRSGKTLRGKRILHTGLTPLAHAAARTKGTYPADLYQRLAACRGRKRPIMAVAHAFVVIAFHMLSRHEPYCELGPSYLDKQRRDYFVDRLTRRMQRLGYRVHLEPVQTA